jgi:hypothetical protein
VKKGSKTFSIVCAAMPVRPIRILERPERVDGVWISVEKGPR